MTGAFAGEEVVVYDTGSDWGPAESADGNSIPFDATEAQFVRHWSAGSTGNDGVNFIEAEFYGQPASTGSTGNTGAICFTGDSLLTLDDGSTKKFRDLQVRY